MNKFVEKTGQTISKFPQIQTALAGASALLGVPQENIGRESWEEHLRRSALDEPHQHEEEEKKIENQEQISQRGQGRQGNWARFPEEEKKEEEKKDWDDWLPESQRLPPRGNTQINRTEPPNRGQSWIPLPPVEVRQQTDQEQWKKWFMTYVGVDTVIEYGPDIVKKIWDLYWEDTTGKKRRDPPVVHQQQEKKDFGPVPSHCRRIFFTNQFGVLDSMVVCNDEKGQRIYMHH